MDNTNRRAGVVELLVDGEVMEVASEGIEYGGFHMKREMLVGGSGVQGYSEEFQVPYVSCEIRDSSKVDLSKLQNVTNGTILVKLANGKGCILRNAAYCAEGKVSTKGATIEARWEGMSGEEI